MMMASGVSSMKRSSPEIPEGDEFFGLKTACAESDHQLCAAGDWGVSVGRIGEDLQDGVEGVRGDEIVLGDVGAHYSAAPARAGGLYSIKDAGCSRCNGRDCRRDLPGFGIVLVAYIFRAGGRWP